MERRNDTRFRAGSPVHVRTLESAPHTLAGTLVDISASGVCTLLPERLRSGSLVELKLADTVLYGQIAYANEERAGFRTGIGVEPVLLATSDLTQIMRVLLEDAAQQSSVSE